MKQCFEKVKIFFKKAKESLRNATRAIHIWWMDVSNSIQMWWNENKVKVRHILSAFLLGWIIRDIMVFLRGSVVIFENGYGAKKETTND